MKKSLAILLVILFYNLVLLVCSNGDGEQWSYLHSLILHDWYV